MNRLYAVVGIVLLFSMALGVWFHQHDKLIAERAAAHARIERDSASLKALEDTIKLVKIALNASARSTKDALAAYDSARAHVRTRVINVPGGVDTLKLTDTVKVTVGFIESADSLRTTCQALANDCARFRLVADSTIAQQGRIIEQLKIIGSPPKIGLMKRIGRFAMVFGAGYLTAKVTK